MSSVAISSGFIEFKLVVGKPSITYNGSLPAFTDPEPLIRIVFEPPGRAEFVFT